MPWPRTISSGCAPARVDSVSCEAPVGAERRRHRLAARLTEVMLQADIQGLGSLFAVRIGASGDLGSGCMVARCSRVVRFKAADSTFEPGQVLRQGAHLQAGPVLLVGMGAFQEGELLQFGVGLGEGQHGGIAGGDRLDLGVGQLLPADVLGPAHARFAASSPGR